MRHRFTNLRAQPSDRRRRRNRIPRNSPSFLPRPLAARCSRNFVTAERGRAVCILGATRAVKFHLIMAAAPPTIPFPLRRLPPSSISSRVETVVSTVSEIVSVLLGKFPHKQVADNAPFFLTGVYLYCVFPSSSSSRRDNVARGIQFSLVPAQIKVRERALNFRTCYSRLPRVPANYHDKIHSFKCKFGPFFRRVLDAM